MDFVPVCVEGDGEVVFAVVGFHAEVAPVVPAVFDGCGDVAFVVVGVFGVVAADPTHGYAALNGSRVHLDTLVSRSLPV